jgi:hypothetical protein
VTFLSPLYLLGALAAAVPVVLHFLHHQPEARVKFAAVRLLRGAPVEDTKRRRIREWLLLALRVGALVLIALAFARPLVRSASAARSGITIVAVDTSLSMSAPGAFDKAKQLARDEIARTPRGTLVGLMTFDDGAHVLTPPTADRALVLSLLDRAQPGFGATRYRAAMSAAAQMAAASGSDSPQVAVVTDLQASGWDSGERAAVPEGARIELLDTGPTPADLAIVAAEAREGRVSAIIRNSGDRSVDVHVTLVVDGAPRSEARAAVAAHDRAQVQLDAAAGATATVHVDDPGGIRGNNDWFLLLGRGGSSPIDLITANGDAQRDAFYVERALEAEGSETAGRVRPVAAGAIGSAAAPLDGTAAVVLLSTRGLDARGRAALGAYLRTGGGLVVAAGEDVDGDVMSELLGGAVTMSTPQAGERRGNLDAHLVASDLRHPLFQPFGASAAALGTAVFRAVATLSTKACDTIARFTSGEPAVLDCGVGGGRAIVFASDLDNRGNDLPLHTAFVPLLSEAVRYVGSRQPAGRSYFVSDVPPGVTAAPGIAAVPPATGAAVSPAAGSSTGPARIAVNVNPAESESDRLSPDEFQSAVSRLREAGRSDAQLRLTDVENRQHLWEYAVLLAIAVLVAESIVSARTA